MQTQKLESELNLSLSLPVAGRMMCPILCSGYNLKTDIWKLILMYQGSLEDISREIPFSYVPLLGRFAIIEIASPDISKLLSQPQVLYLELSRPLYPNVTTGLSSSCINAAPFIPDSMPLSSSDSGSLLTGKGTAAAIIDTGIDYRHPDFQNPDGTTRILTYWDQNMPYDGINRYRLGRIFSGQELNQILADTETDIKPGPDLTGHGTHVAGICAGNGRNSGGKNHGVAPEANLVIVALKNENQSVYSDYASLMMAVDYVVRYAADLSLPLSVNISYGSNDGPHDGTSLIERFFQNCIYYGRNVIAIATGNEGLSRRHAGSAIPASLYNTDRRVYPFPFAVAPGERSLYLQLWKSPADRFDYQLILPEQDSAVIPGKPGIYSYTFGSNQILVSVGESTPYQPRQEIFLALGVTDTISRTEGGSSPSYLSSGIWQFQIIPLAVADGRVNLWLPGKETTNSGTGFLEPSSELTLTVPSTAFNVISVSGYDSSSDTFASFSGQGYSGYFLTRPDLCAPAVNILSTTPGGGYGIRSGTSMAAPFVSGSAALLMEWGIIRGNDPFMYGEKIKAALWNGARMLPAFSKYPNPQTGWGKLCLGDSFPD